MSIYNTRLTVRTHFPKDDPKCVGDFSYIDIVDDTTGYVIAKFGDYYHDKGDVKAEGFIEGVEWAIALKVHRTDINVADAEY